MAKPNYTPEEAGIQITRANDTWAAAIPAPVPVVVSFAFRLTAPPVNYDGGGISNPNDPPTLQTLIDTFTQFSETQINATLAILNLFSEVANISFTRVGTGTSGPGAYSDAATMLFANYSLAGIDAEKAAFAYLPDHTVANRADALPERSYGDAFFDRNQTDNQDNGLFLGSYGYSTLIHEIGHSLGLEHPGDYNAAAGQKISYANDAVYFEDSLQYTLMSYFEAVETGANHTPPGATRAIYGSTLLLDDIAALQRLYGANMTARTGDTVYGFDSNADNNAYHLTSPDQNVVFAVWDAGGTDTFNFSGYATNQVIDLRAGHFSSVGDLTSNVAIALGVTIENAIGGSGDDQITGNDVANVLEGRAGDDRLFGGLGDDTLDGGAGTDTALFSGVRAAYSIADLGDSIRIGGPEGTDTALNIEFLTFVNKTIRLGPLVSTQWAGSPDLGLRAPPVQVAGIGDFDDDRISDVLWRDPGTGHVDEWRMAGGNWSASIDLGSRAGGYQVAGIGDFNGDGTSDVLWRDASTGQTDGWLMRGGSWASSIDLGSRAGGYQVAGIGDFNGDGTSDVLWRDPVSGKMDAWLMRDGNWSASIDLGSRAGGYQVAGVGDFNADGFDDVLWRNPGTGQVDEWTFINGQWAGSVALGAFDTAYNVAAVNDFNGDGTSDVLWRNPSTGQVEGWAMRDATWGTSFSLGSMNPAFQLAGTGTFSSELGADVLWRDTASGQTGAWLLTPV